MTLDMVYQTVIVHRGLIIGKTYLGTRFVASPRAHRMLSVPVLRHLLRNRYLGRAG